MKTKTISYRPFLIGIAQRILRGELSESPSLVGVFKSIDELNSYLQYAREMPRIVDNGYVKLVRVREEVYQVAV